LSTAFLCEKGTLQKNSERERKKSQPWRMVKRGKIKRTLVGGFKEASLATTTVSYKELSKRFLNECWAEKR